MLYDMLRKYGAGANCHINIRCVRLRLKIITRRRPIGNFEKEVAVHVRRK
jgi:hypothetical protein